MTHCIGTLRIGLGHDIHRLVSGDSIPRDGISQNGILLGGVRIDHTMSLLGHSDADVLLHAVTDALLGASGLGDIGELFPDTEPANRNRDSAEMLRTAWTHVQHDGWHIVNLDIVVFAERPKIAPHKTAIRHRIAELLDIDIMQVGLKAKTGEGIGIIGREEAVAVQCVVLLMNRNANTVS